METGSIVVHGIYPKLTGRVISVSKFGVEVEWQDGKKTRSLPRFIVPIEEAARISSKHEDVQSVEEDEVEDAPEFKSRLEAETEDAQAAVTEEEPSTAIEEAQGHEPLPTADEEDTEDEFAEDE